MLLLLMLLLLDATSWLTWNIRHNLVQIVVAFSGLTCLYVCKEIPPSFGPSSSAAVVIAPRRWQQKRTHYQFAFPWPPRIFCFGAAYVSGIKETAPGETPRSRLKRRIVEVEEEEEGRRRSVQSDALERARNWGTFSHLYHYYYYQLPSKQARQRTDGRTDGCCCCLGWPRKPRGRLCYDGRLFQRYKDTRPKVARDVEKARARAVEQRLLLLRSRFFEASLHTTSRVPTIVVASARKCRKSATHMYVWYQCHWRSRCQGLCTVIPPPPLLFLLLLDVDGRQASRQTHLLPQEHRLRHGEEVLSELTLPINNNAVVSSTVICWRCSGIILKKSDGLLSWR